MTKRRTYRPNTTLRRRRVPVIGRGSKLCSKLLEEGWILDCNELIRLWRRDIDIVNEVIKTITCWSSILLNSRWEVPPKKSIFHHMHFHQNRHTSLSAIFIPTEILNSNYKFCDYKEYSLKVHIPNFRNRGKLTWGNFKNSNGGKRMITRIFRHF